MIYNNLIYLLVVVLVLSTHGTPAEPQIPLQYAILLFITKGLFFFFAVHRTHSRKSIHGAPQYFSVEQKFSITAIILLAIDVYFLDCQYYFGKLPLAEKLPTIVNLGGIILFFAYLTIVWAGAKKSYLAVFGRNHTTRSFVAANLKINIPIILPWLLLSLLSDLLQLSNIRTIKNILASPWGEPTTLLLFFVLLATGFPLLVTKLWDCKSLPQGPTRSHIEKICRDQKLKYADIMTWPLFEGRVLTAGVMGLTKHFRYLLITPALLEAMTPEEIESVIAHEIGHVKRYHLQLYLVLFLGFGLLAQLSIYPIIYLLLNSNLFYQITLLANKDPGAALTMMSTVPMLLLMILYFRFIFGFFMRNFERQADLHAFTVMNSSAPIIRVFEKIAWLSGKIRDLPSWHHFGIGQRIDFLQKCELDRSYVSKHHRKVYLSLVLYLLVITSAAIGLWKMPADLLEGAPKAKFAEAVIKQKIAEEPKNPLWYQFMGDLQASRELYDEAIENYEKALTINTEDPVVFKKLAFLLNYMGNLKLDNKKYSDAITYYEKYLRIDNENPEVLNNLAWLLLTAEDKTMRNPVRALRFAQIAARLKPSGHILDTLANAYWSNGLKEEAITIEKQAIQVDPASKEFYVEQLEKFTSPHNKESL